MDYSNSVQTVGSVHNVQYIHAIKYRLHEWPGRRPLIILPIVRFVLPRNILPVDIASNNDLQASEILPDRLHTNQDGIRLCNIQCSDWDSIEELVEDLL